MKSFFALLLGAALLVGCDNGPINRDGRQRPLPPAPVVPARSFTLAVGKVGEGTVSTERLSCGDTCSQSYPEGSTLTLTAASQNGFLGWTGACSGTAPCTVVMNQDQFVTARFVVPVVIVTPSSPVPMPTPVKACDAFDGPASFNHYLGLMHEHSSYSDGDIDSIPADYFKAAKDKGFSFVGSSEHSDSYDQGNFVSVGDRCFTTPDGLLTCLTPSDQKLQKWTNTAAQIRAATSATFLGIRGFEWTSDRFGHINVYFSKNFSNAKTDNGFAVTLDAFWQWFTRAPDSSIGLGGSPTSPTPNGGGSDALAHFNHPSDKCLPQAEDQDPGCNWNDFAYIPDADLRMFGMELYNDGGRRDHYFTDWMKALDKGWHLSPVGSEDEHGKNFASPQRAKTVTLAPALSEAAFKEAWLKRRTYALVSANNSGGDVFIEVNAEGHPMGSRLNCTLGSSLPFEVNVRRRSGETFNGQIKLYSNTGKVVAESVGSRLKVSLPVTASERWYALRVNQADGQSVAYAAPVWIKARN
jgi:hypothetical protein